jgi:sensor histidine kinase YesM
VRIDEEVEYLTSYLELEKMRFKDRIDYEVAVDEMLALKDVLIPPITRARPVIRSLLRTGSLNN